MADAAHYRVMLIDDSQAEAEMVEAMLTSVRHPTFSLEWQPTYDQGLAGVLRGEHDVYLVDYNLGHRSGLDLLRAARAEGSRAAIVMLTARGSHEIDVEAMQAGVTEYLEKDGLRAVLLARTIRYAVKHQQDQVLLQDMNARLKALETLKTDMIRIAAHDLRGPLMVVLTYGQMLHRALPEALPTEQHYAREILEAGGRIQEIISDILNLERIEEMAGDMRAERVLLDAVIEQSVVRNEPAAADKHQQYTYEVDGPLWVQGDALLLEQACTNLISNAVKYTAEGGEVCVKAERHGALVRFSVTDTGYGIPADMQERLFHPFYRVRTRETRSIAGLGLGLHLVRNIVERHGGEVFFDSTYGQGSTFGFTVPADT